MSTITANYHFQPKDPSRSATGLIVVVGLHVVIGYALVSGLARDIVKVIKKPLDAAVIQEVKLPPPPPPPPKVAKLEQAPKPKAPPPPAYVPPPEIAPPAAAPVIAASSPTPPPEPARIEPPAPPAPPAAAPRPVRQDIAASCPGQVRPEVPRGAEGVGGVIRAQALIREGAVREVTILSGPKVFHSAVRSAMLQYKCVSGDNEIVATQQFVFEAG
ncbi:energy transducer TonB [Zoogloea sp.]|uniref:energy transducer TonB n=1 Tax=Zoogloea sp. TaxID=49181 RepID=UPI002605B168|nr:energy transducer TonB [Zoogloea sp.]MDD3352635.1 energy transducer TonB [Zoogloea sp.]